VRVTFAVIAARWPRSSV